MKRNIFDTRDSGTIPMVAFVFISTFPKDCVPKLRFTGTILFPTVPSRRFSLTQDERTKEARMANNMIILFFIS